MSTADLQFTRYTAITPKRLSKRFTHVGGALIKEGGGNMTDGIAERLTVASLTEFAALLPTLTPNQALSYGINGHDRARAGRHGISGFFVLLNTKTEFMRLLALENR